jgi:hypothetical protein
MSRNYHADSRDGWATTGDSYSPGKKQYSGKKHEHSPPSFLLFQLSTVNNSVLLSSDSRYFNILIFKISLFPFMDLEKRFATIHTERAYFNDTHYFDRLAPDSEATLNAPHALRNTHH